MKLIVCALAVVALTQAIDDIDFSSQKITGGIEAVPNSIPYQVAIVETTTAGESYCGGSLISTKYVLTSARCIQDAISILVKLGAHRRNEVEDTQVRLTSTKYAIHPGYTPGDTHLHNIAVVELPEAVELNDYIKPIDLPTWSDAAKDFADHFARFSGWGYDAQGTGSAVLLYAFADVITNSLCYSSYPYVTISHICTSGNGGVGMCTGDTGGPLVADGVQVGIASFVTGCGTGNPTGFTRVTYYLDWIAQNTDVVIKQ